MRSRFFSIMLPICAIIFLASCDECRKVECLNDGICDEGICVCPDGFSGELCNVEDLCITDDPKCSENGECVDGECECNFAYHGERCEDYCLYGTYTDGNCECSQGYQGPNCDTLSREKFLGAYTVTSTMPGGTKLSKISEGDWTTQETWKVTLPNIAFDDDTDGYGEIEGNTISFPDQKVIGLNSDTFGYNVKMLQAGTLIDDGTTVTFSIKVSRTVDTAGAETVVGTHTYERASN